MKKKRILILISVFLIVGLGVFLVINGFGKKQLASLEVDSNINLPLYVDGNLVGNTPFTTTMTAKEVRVKLGSFETEVNLTPGIKTIIKRNFTKDGVSSGGVVVSFIKNDSDNATLAVVSNPDGGQIKVDGTLRGFAPMNIDLTNGTHQLVLEANGYTSSNFAVNLVNGYKLIAVVDLLSSEPSTTTKNTAVSTSSQNLNQVMVQILATPTGFLRVRKEPTITSDEIGQVHPGEKYPFVVRDDKTGWYQIQLTASSSGWVSDTYVATSSASPN